MLLLPADRHLDRDPRRRWSGSSPASPRRAAGSSGCCSATREPFGVQDPQFGVDIGFYVFEYPFWRYLLGVGFTAMVLSAARRAGRALRLRRGAPAGRRRPDDGRRAGPPDRAGRGVRAAQGGRVLPGPARPAARTTTQRRPTLYGAGYTDINALLPAKEILAYISHRGGDRDPGVLQRGRCATWSGPASSLALLGISAVAIGGIYPGRRCSRSRSSRACGTRKRRTSSAASTRTRQAYGLADVRDRVRTRRNDRRRRPSLATDTAHGAEHPAARPERSSTRRTPSCSRSAASTTSATSSTSTGTRSTATTPRTTWSASGRSTTTS